MPCPARALDPGPNSACDSPTTPVPTRDQAVDQGLPPAPVIQVGDRASQGRIAADRAATACDQRRPPAVEDASKSDARRRAGWTSTTRVAIQSTWTIRPGVSIVMRKTSSWIAAAALGLSAPFFSAYLDARAVHAELPFTEPRPIAVLPDALQRLTNAGYRLTEQSRVCGGVGDYYRLHKQGRWGVREITIMAIFPVDKSFSSAAYRSAFIDAFSFDHP